MLVYECILWQKHILNDKKKAKNTTNINKLTFILFVRVDGQVVGVMISAAPRSRPG